MKKKTLNKNKNTNNDNIHRIINNKKNLTLSVIILIVITFLAFSQSMKNELVDWDDKSYLTKNEVIFQNENALYFFGKNIFMGNYHPLTMSLYDLQYSIAEFNPKIYHFTNVLLHIINVLLVFFLIRIITDKKLLWPSTTAIFFAIHPLHVESVTWVSELKDVLYTMFFLLSIIVYQKNNTKIFSRNYIISLLMFILACLAKGMAVTLPLALILIEYFKTKQLKIKYFIDKIPFFVVSLIFGMIAVYAQSISEAVKDLQSFTFIERILLPSYSAAFYLFKTFLPLKLSIFYPYPKSGEFGLIYWISPFLLIGLGLLILKLRKTKVEIAFGLLLYFAMISTVIQIKPVGEAIAADRYFYVASIGIFFIFGYFIDYLFEKVTLYQRQIFLIPIILFGLTCFYLTFNRTKDWKDTKTLWQSAIDANPELDKAYYGVGNVYYSEGDYVTAKKLFLKCLEKNPLNEKANNNLGNIYYMSNNLDSATLCYEKVIEKNPRFSQGFYNLGNIYFVKQDLDRAIEYYERAIRIEPKNEMYLEQYNKALELKEKAE